MLRIVLLTKIKWIVKLSFYTTYFFILPTYKKGSDNGRIKYIFTWLTLALFIDKPKN